MSTITLLDARESPSSIKYATRAFLLFVVSFLCYVIPFFYAVIEDLDLDQTGFIFTIFTFMWFGFIVGIVGFYWSIKSLKLREDAWRKYVAFIGNLLIILLTLYLLSLCDFSFTFTPAN